MESHRFATIRIEGLDGCISGSNIWTIDGSRWQFFPTVRTMGPMLDSDLADWMVTVRKFELTATPPDANPDTLPIVCPYCRKNVMLEVLSNFRDMVAKDAAYRLGHRRCPNPDCLAHLFVVVNNRRISVSYPPASIPFDREQIPESIATVFDEAITCHANQCYVASAIMIRKTLEELCADKGATGSDLKKRIDALGEVVILPQEFLDAMHDLRALGNDGAHVELKTFDSVSEEEVTTGIEVTKELLRAVYQYESLIDKLKGLKRQPENDGVG